MYIHSVVGLGVEFDILAVGQISKQSDRSIRFIIVEIVHYLHTIFLWIFSNQCILNHIGCVMVSVLASGAVDRGFKPWSGQTKDYKIGICCFSTKHASLRRKNKDMLVRNQNYLSEWERIDYQLTVVSVSLHYANPTQRIGREQSGPHHHFIEN